MHNVTSPLEHIEISSSHFPSLTQIDKLPAPVSPTLVPHGSALSSPENKSPKPSNRPAGPEAGTRLV